MYLKHFNLTERPFSITPDPRFLYMSARHREALAHLLYGLGEGGGFVQLTGEVGTGKTTICRCLLEQVPDNVDLALVLNPKVTAVELIATVCDELGIEYPAGTSSIKTLTDLLNKYLLDAYARGRRTVLVIDEAQNLGADVLEQVRLLTNLETATQKLLQIVLIGQPELRDLLAREDMRQLAQRVTARYHLEPISRGETEAYIKHRLQICGISRSLFNKRAVDRIQQLSGGIPRLINVLCDRAMLGAYVESKAEVDHKVVSKAAREVLATEQGASGGWNRTTLLAGGLVLLVLAMLAAAYQPWRYLEQPAVPDTPDETVSDRLAAARERMSLAAARAPEPKKPEAEPEVQGLAAAEAQSLAALLLAADSSYYRIAWTELLALWSVELPTSVKPDFCDFARQYGLLCLIEQGSWDSLRQFDRPVILKLVADDGRRVPVVLQHMSDSILELIIGKELYRLSLEQVSRYWHGDYVLLMQALPGGRMYLKAGSHDPDVAWLRQQLEVALGVEIPVEDPLYFDYPLQKRVLEFQRSRGLVPDGVVGKNTIFHLNSVSGRSGVPRLLDRDS
jgi:general secretion pathway protein A